MSIDEFTAAAKKNFETFAAHPFYAVGVRALDDAYSVAIRSAPQEGHPLIYGRLLLVCHKHMVSAANLIAACLPEDSVGISRRAVEAARLAVAIRLNDGNAEAWLSYQERNERWLKRQEGEKPKPFHIKYEDLKGDEVCEALNRYIGMLSDAYVHFTPEYYGVLGWEVKTYEEEPGGQIFLNYFQSDTREIERHFILLMAIHGNILQALNRCLDGYLYRNTESKNAVDHFWRTAKSLNDGYGRRYGVTAVALNEAEEQGES